MDKLKHINNLCKNTLISHLGIEITGVGENYLKGTMPVDKRTINPRSVLHGGASLALLESLGSGLSYYTSDMDKFDVFGIEVNANHVRSMKTGEVYGIAKFLHKGKRTHVVRVEIFNNDHKLVSVGRITNMIVEKNA